MCASPAYLDQRSTPQDARDLTAHNFLTYAHFGSTSWYFQTPDGDVTVPVSGNFSTNEALIVVRAAHAGTGIALLPEFAAAKSIYDGNLVCLLPEAQVTPLNIFALYLTRDRMPSAMRALQDTSHSILSGNTVAP